MSFDSDKFANLIIRECNHQTALMQRTPVHVPACKTRKKFAPEVQFGTMLIGVFALLVACIALFDGVMVPAMWQLTSVIWIMWRVFKA